MKILVDIFNQIKIVKMLGGERKESLYESNQMAGIIAILQNFGINLSDKPC